MAEIIVALDVPTAEDALLLVDRLGPELDFVKVGLELYTREGPALVRTLRDRGLRVFLDLKLHDIPRTVAGAVRSARALDVELLTLHASGGVAMMTAALEAAHAGSADPAEASVGSGGRGMRLLAVTVLTSLSGAEVAEGWGRDAAGLTPEAEVLRLARLSSGVGIPGVVASAQEARGLREALGPDLLLVTPGIRFAGGKVHDQVRVATPGHAVSAGSTHLVMGRALTGAPDPALALARARQEVEDAGGELPSHPAPQDTLRPGSRTGVSSARSPA